MTIRLVACVGTSAQADQLDLNPFDEIVAGYPYCAFFPGQINHDEAALERLLERAENYGTKVRFRPLALPFEPDFKGVCGQIERAAQLGTPAVEIADVGLLRYVSRRFPDLAITLGPLANITTSLTAELMKKAGVQRQIVGVEVSFREMLPLLQAGIELEVPVHGCLPLGLARGCLLQSEQSENCPGDCRRPAKLSWETFGTLAAGKLLLSDKEYCLIEHLAYLRDAGVVSFRLDGTFISIDRLSALGRLYRQVLSTDAGREPYCLSDEEWRLLGTKGKLCNGFFFGHTGQLYFSEGDRP